MPPSPSSSSRRLLQAGPLDPPGIPPADPPAAVSSDVVVILAALLCALICVVGLAAVARCARSRRNAASNAPTDAAPTAGASAPDLPVATVATSKGLKKKALKALPKLAYQDAVAAAAAARGAAAGEEKVVLSECAICLAEFEDGEEVRVMPQCGHGFHVGCVDTWLRAHSSCPSCRRPLLIDDPPPKRCRKCEAMGASSSHAAAGGSGFLP